MRYLPLLLVLLICAESFSQRSPQYDPVLFTVSDNPVKASEFIYLYEKNNQGRKDAFTEGKVLEYLDLYVNFKLKVREAVQRGMDTTASFINELNSYKAELKKPYLAQQDDVDRLVKEAYNRMTEEVNASHILINVAQDAGPKDTLTAFNKAVDIRNKALAGESFEKLAREFSDDPSAKANGGNLGYFSTFQMVYPFESAAFETKPGEISMPVRTQFGYHLVKVLDKRPARGEVEVSHIFIRGNDEKSKEKIMDVAQQLKSGKTWDEMCLKYSEDPGTKNEGGRLRPFGVGALSSAPQFEETAFSLSTPGEISDPVQTGFGWHILRLERKIPIPPLSEIEATLKRKVARDERTRIFKDRELEKRKKEFEFVLNDHARNLILSKVDSTLSKGNWNVDTANEFGDQPLFSLMKKSFLVSDLLPFIKSSQRASSLSPEKYFDELLEQYVKMEIDKLEDERLQREHPEYRNMLKEYHEGILMFSIMEKEVWNKASDDSVGQRKYYNEHLGSYKAGDRIEARIFSTSERQAMASLKTKIESGDTLTSKDLGKIRTIPFRKYERGDHEAIDRISWTIGLAETEVNGMYYLVEVSKLVPPGSKDFDEARASVISDYQDFLEKKWINELKEKYPVKINKKGRKFVLKQLVTGKGK